MHHHLIHGTELSTLTIHELRELEAKLRQILHHDTSLTDRDIAVILASLADIRAAWNLRHVAKLARQPWAP
jgi:hypothetical protein